MVMKKSKFAACVEDSGGSKKRKIEMNSEKAELKTLEEEYFMATREFCRVKSRDLSPPDPYLVKLREAQ